jgi:hypothetical protein
MSVSYYNLFGLKYDFSSDDLYNAYSNKVEEINKSTLSSMDKLFMTQQVNEMYHKARKNLNDREESKKLLVLPIFSSFYQSRNMLNNDLSLLNYFDAFDRTMDLRIKNLNRQLDEVSKRFETSSKDNNKMFLTETSYKEKYLPDGSKLVIETNTTKNNDVTEHKTSRYKVHKDGNIETLTMDEAERMLK